MENAAAAVSSLFAKNPAPKQDDENTTNGASNSAPSASNGDNVDSTTDSEVAPAIKNSHVKEQHETREQTFVEKGKHKDHYQTTIQPLKDSEILPETNDHTQETEHLDINKDDGTAKEKAEADRAGFESTSDSKQFEAKTTEPGEVEEHVHHHVHETVQPVIEKDMLEVIAPSVTHKRVDVKEKIQEPAEYHGTSTKPAMPLEDFQKTVDE